MCVFSILRAILCQPFLMPSRAMWLPGTKPFCVYHFFDDRKQPSSSLHDLGGLVPKSCLSLGTPWNVVCQAPLSMGFPRQEYQRGSPFPSPGDLPDPAIEPVSPALQADSCIAGGFFTDWATREASIPELRLRNSSRLGDLKPCTYPNPVSNPTLWNSERKNARLLLLWFLSHLAAWHETSPCFPGRGHSSGTYCVLPLPGREIKPLFISPR